MHLAGHHVRRRSAQVAGLVDRAHPAGHPGLPQPVLGGLRGEGLGQRGDHRWLVDAEHVVGQLGEAEGVAQQAATIGARWR